MKLYKYTGTISEVSFRNRTACDIKLYDMNDRDKAPTRLEVFGALGKYILDIEGTVQKSGTSRTISTLMTTCTCGASKFPAGAIGLQRLSPSRLTTLTSWRSSESGSTSKPASRSPCPARK